MLPAKTEYIRIASNAFHADKIPVFLKPFWLDAVSKKWDVVIVKENDVLLAALPYCIKGNILTKRIYLPFLSFYQSVLFFQDVKQEEQQTILEQLVDQLPLTWKQYFKFLPQYSNLDLSNQDYTKHGYSTYVIQDKFQLSEHHSRLYKKVIKNEYKLVETENTDQAYALLMSTFIRKNLKPYMSLHDFEKIQTVCKKFNAGKIVSCTDKQQNHLACIFYAEDEQSAYYLMGGYDDQFKNSGAMVFLLHELISQAIKQKKQFNFCGSADANIARFFEGFGAEKIELNIWTKGLMSRK
ncbi:MAG TPA: hypothetical protein PLF48_03625 [Chitinophagales bacterium]|nr:hypothetical protein [Chitinophagales bacterium]